MPVFRVNPFLQLPGASFLRGGALFLPACNSEVVQGPKGLEKILVSVSIHSLVGLSSP
jgi:hypothetical protein